MLRKKGYIMKSSRNQQYLTNNFWKYEDNPIIPNSMPKGKKKNLVFIMYKYNQSPKKANWQKRSIPKFIFYLMKPPRIDAPRSKPGIWVISDWKIMHAFNHTKLNYGKLDVQHTFEYQENPKKGQIRKKTNNTNIHNDFLLNKKYLQSNHQ